MKRTAQITDTSIRYTKERTYKNHSKKQKCEYTYGSFDCRFKFVRWALGVLWKWAGVRVLR